MSAGNLLGSVFAAVMSTAVWLVIGWAIDKVGVVFNRTISILPSFQDAVNGFNQMQSAYVVILAIIWVTIWLNYAINESNESGGYV